MDQNIVVIEGSGFCELNLSYMQFYSISSPSGPKLNRG